MQPLTHLPSSNPGPIDLKGPTEAVIRMASAVDRFPKACRDEGQTLLVEFLAGLLVVGIVLILFFKKQK